MKRRCDFVSNSSSSSFIVDDQEKIKFNETFGGPNKFTSIKDFKQAEITLRDSIRTALQDYCKSLDIHSIDSLSEYTYLDDCLGNFSWILKSLDDTIKDLEDINKRSDGTIIEELRYITEPVDRDDAYTRGFDSGLWKGDL